LHLASAMDRQERQVDDVYRYFKYSHASKCPSDAGHDYAEWLRDQGEDPASLLAKTSRVPASAVRRNRQFSRLKLPSAECDIVPPHLHQTHWCTLQAIDFMGQQQDRHQPWMLSVNPFDPHPSFDRRWDYYRRYDPEQLPGAHFRSTDLTHEHRLEAAGDDFQSTSVPPDECEHRKVQAAYYAMIEQIDHEFGRIIDFLDETGQRQNTFVIFTRDHGATLGDHGLWLKGCRLYEGLTCVPLLISWPARFSGGNVGDALVEVIDLAPTILDAAGLTGPCWAQGRSLLPLLAGETAEHRTAVRAECYNAIAYPDRRWKHIHYHDKNLHELYDLRNDPWEHDDLSTDPAHRDTLHDLMRESFNAAVRAPAGASAGRLPLSYQH
jgi:arylsulfatase